MQHQVATLSQQMGSPHNCAALKSEVHRGGETGNLLPAQVSVRVLLSRAM